MASQADAPSQLAAPTASPLQRCQYALFSALTFCRRYPVGAVGGVLLLFISMVAAFAGLFSPHDPLYVDFLSLGAAPPPNICWVPITRAGTFSVG